MQRWIVLSGLGFLVLVVAIQFIPVETANPPVESDIPTSPAVKAILRSACYDCHSHETVWPWYSHIAPISWLLARDVREGRAELNFSTWNRYSTQQHVKKLKESWEEVREGEMPPWYYLPVHREAQLSAADRTLLEQWARTSTEGSQSP
jgi:cbb3-type cytochrome oxidase cytochrome c subunit